MYYYIVEPLTTQAEKKRVEEIKMILSQLGIAGEFAVASPARTVEEHLELAFRKGFSTIVGIGRDSLASQVAGRLIATGYTKAALGFIPLQTGQELWQMIGATSIRQICESLRTRRVLSIDAMAINDEKFFITPATAHFSRPLRFQLIFPHYGLEGQFTNLSIMPTGQLTISDASQVTQSWFSRLFRKPQADNSSATQLMIEECQLLTERPCSLIVDSLAFAQTPIQLQHRPQVLKLIVNRAKITEKENSSTN